MILAALGDPDIALNRFRKSEMFHAQLAVVAGPCSKLGLQDAAVNQMIIEGERMAFERGWHPPPAHGGTAEP